MQPSCFFSILISLICIVSCDLLAPGNRLPVWTEGPVIFRISEAYESYGTEQDPVLYLTMQTEKIYGCCNFSIAADIDFTPDVITVSLREVIKPEICLTALGPALFREPFPVPPGTYTFTVRTADSTDTHTLVITDSSVVIRPGSTGISRPDTTLLWRFPRRSFAAVLGTTTETAWMCEAFIDSLKGLPALREFHFPDSGLIPYPTVSSGYWHNEPARYFTYSSEANFDTAGAVLSRFSRSVIGTQQGIGFFLVNWRNKWYRSWMSGND